ncbi:MAG: hypothetical protein K6F84_02465, partial [Lachnospiraceae bacterium]|nr:hypothetical protein [Lachnospiraceae bacterium]
YDLKEAVDFKTAYLAGYLADRYDVSCEDCIEKANDRIKASTTNAFLSTVEGYSSVTPEDTGIRLNNAKAKYGLLPVWLLNTTWKGTKYVFAMNGQTGKFVGDLPADKSMVTKYHLIYGAIIAVVIFLISRFAL